jgi:hypothetical protein
MCIAASIGLILTWSWQQRHVFGHIFANFGRKIKVGMDLETGESPASILLK